NVMIDTLCWALPQAVALDAPTRLGVGGRPYAVVTLHRPANVDDPLVLGELLDALTRLAEHVPVLFPVHPRTRKQIQELLRRPPPEGRLRLLEPLGWARRRADCASGVRRRVLRSERGDGGAPGAAPRGRHAPAARRGLKPEPEQTSRRRPYGAVAIVCVTEEVSAWKM